MDALLPDNSGERRTSADIIFAKLESGMTNGVNVMQKVQQGTNRISVAWAVISCFVDQERPDPALGLDARLVESYSKYVFSRFQCTQ